MSESKEKKWTDDDLEYAMKKARYSGMLVSLRDRRELLVQIRDMIDRELAYVDDRINSTIEAQKTITNFVKDSAIVDDLFKGV